MNLYLTAKLKEDVEKVREVKEEKRQESARLAQELRCVEEKNRWMASPSQRIASFGRFSYGKAHRTPIICDRFNGHTWWVRARVGKLSWFPADSWATLDSNFCRVQ